MSGYALEAGFAPGQTALSVPVSRTSLTVPNVGTGRYYVRVKALNGVGAGAASNEVAVTVGCVGASAAPQAFTPATSGQLVSLRWVDPDGCSGSRYLLVVGSQPGAQNLGAVPLDSSGVTVAAPAGTYYARVATQSDFGISLLSNEAPIAVSSDECRAPSIAMSLGASVSGRVVTLAWSPTSVPAALAADAVAPIQYVLEVGATQGAASLRFPLGRTTAAAIPAPPGDYHVRVRALNVCGAGPASPDAFIGVR